MYGTYCNRSLEVISLTVRCHVEIEAQRLIRSAYTGHVVHKRRTAAHLLLLLLLLIASDVHRSPTVPAGHLVTTVDDRTETLQHIVGRHILADNT